MFGVPYHFLAVHFPLVLVMLALFYDGRGVYDVGYRLTIGAAASALIGVATGLMLAGGQFSRMTVHASASLVGSLAIVTLAMLRYSRNARDEEALVSLPAAWLILEILAVLGILTAAITGHRAVIGY